MDAFLPLSFSVSLARSAPVKEREREKQTERETHREKGTERKGNSKRERKTYQWMPSSP